MKNQMIEMHMRDLENTEGGFLVFTPAILTAAAVAAGGYVVKDIYDNWGAFKKAVADGWNAV